MKPREDSANHTIVKCRMFLRYQAYIDIYESTDNISAAEVMVLRLKYG
jgi:hypothetical protein